jgi:WD40 repeat protein
MAIGTTSLTSNVRGIEAGSHVVAVQFVRESAIFANGEGEILIADDREVRIKVHSGAILAAAGDGLRIFTAGDDGKLFATDLEGKREVIADSGGKWIDQIALSPSGTVAWSVGKMAFVRANKGERKMVFSSTVSGLAFAPKGLRLAVAHYGGASLWFPNTDAKPEMLSWKGSHRGVTFSPDGRFLVTTMQEPALHGWRLSDGQDMRMSGYPSRVRSFGFTADAKWLASSGAQEVILWPFSTRDGPMGKQPLMLAPGPKDTCVAIVACHPTQEVLAAGYSDGTVMLVRLADGAEILVRRASGTPVTALGWRSDGKLLAFGAEDGKAGLLLL